MPDQASAIAQRRPDMDAANCRDCINQASDQLTTNCTDAKEAIEGYQIVNNYCMLRDANRSIFNMENAPYFFVYNPASVTEDVVEFKQARESLLDRLISPAAAGNEYNKLASGEEPASNLTLYAYVQCTPDLTENECNDCLRNAIVRLPQCCGTNPAGRVIYPSCNFRYAVNPILTDQSTTDTTLNPESPGKGTSTNVIIIVSISVATLVISIICIFVYLKTRKPKDEFENEINNIKALQYELSTIKVATNDFSDANKLGHGGFGVMYKGVLSNRQYIAVKSLLGNSPQLQHRNLVMLLGFCLELTERLLVFEFVPNSSLDHYIFDPIKRETMDWGMRYKIITGIARGLLYLHEDSRLQILLDSEMNPKIADFGTARLFDINQTQESTLHIAGTFGYMAPEYAMRGRFSIKSDVFSFGVLVLETISGQKRRSFSNGEGEDDLPTYAWESWNFGSVLDLVDSYLSDYSTSEMMRCIQIALLCVQEYEVDRPGMATVILMLSTESLALSAPFKPGYY